jgi:hypothetical protein
VIHNPAATITTPTPPLLLWFAFASQTIGGSIILWRGVPLYRKFIAGESADPPQWQLYAWAAVAFTLVHPAYWWMLGSTPPALSKPHPLLGHIVQFLGRAAFIFVAGMFGTIFYVRFGDLGLAWWRYAFVLTMLFTMFCVSRTMERVGAALAHEGRVPRHSPSHRIQ